MEEMLDPAATVSQESSFRKTLKRLRYIDAEYIGEELIFKPTNSKADITLQFCKIFNWYNHTCDRTKSKQWIVEYVRTVKNDKDSADAVQAFTDHFALNVGWLARQIMNGAILPSKYQKYFNQSVEKMIDAGKKSLVRGEERIKNLREGKNQVQKNIEQKLKRATDDCIMEFENQIDVFLGNKFKNQFNFVEYLQEQKILKEQIDEIAEHFAKRHAKELQQIVKGDKELREYYGGYSDAQIKSLYDFIKSIIKSCLEHKESAKTFEEYKKSKRKPRKKKVKPPHVQVKKLLYLSSFADLGLQSISPVKIVGAEQVWIYNTKNRRLGVYNACDSSGLSVKGSTILNFDKEQSIEKTLRKPREVLKGVLEDGKVALRKVMGNVRAKPKLLNGRFNRNIIILRCL